MPLFGKKTQAGRGFVPFDQVKALLSQNASEPEVIESLRKEGFSAEEIDVALSESVKPSFESPPSPVAFQESKPAEEAKTEEKPIEKTATAPLFIKLEKYNKILKSLEELRNTMGIIKNAFSTLNELDKLRRENMKITENTIATIDKRLTALDAEFLKPSGVKEDQKREIEQPSEAYTKNLESELSALKTQIDQLKSELNTIA